MIHPTLPLIATSGVEKIVRMHTPTPFSNSLEVKKTPASRVMGQNETRHSRRDFLLALLTSPHEHEAADVEEDTLTINFFDSLLRRDEDNDLWDNVDSDDADDMERHMNDVLMEFGETDEEDEEDDDDLDDDDMGVAMVGASDGEQSQESEESIDIDEAYPV